MRVNLPQVPGVRRKKIAGFSNVGGRRNGARGNASELRKEGGTMSFRRFAVKVGYSLAGAVILLGSAPARALAQDGHMHTAAIQDKDLSPLQRARMNELVQVV